jgi:hypothetical protein
MAMDDKEPPKGNKHKHNPPQDSGEERSITLTPDELAAANQAADSGQKSISLPPDSTRGFKPLEVADRFEWTKESNWTPPNWLNDEGLTNISKKSYRQYKLTLLRSMYWRLEGDFRTYYNNYYNSGLVDFVVARRLIDTLMLAKKTLERDNCDLVGARDLIGIAEQYMVSLYPKHIAKQRGQVLASKLEYVNLSLSRKLTVIIGDDSKYNTGDLNALLSEITDNLNKQDRDNLISNSLQVTKLENLVKYGKYAVLFLIFTLPFIIKFDADIWKGSIFELRPEKPKNIEIKRIVTSEPKVRKIVTADGKDSTITDLNLTIKDDTFTNAEKVVLEDLKGPNNQDENQNKESDNKPQIAQRSLFEEYLLKWGINLAIAILGAVGAFFSGLISLRKSRIQLSDYEESMTNYSLRIIIGAVAAMILFVFISWNIIPGLAFTSAGGILFFCFLAGFSERYFLDKLGVEAGEDGSTSVKANMTAPAIAQMPETSEPPPQDVPETAADDASK